MSDRMFHVLVLGGMALVGCGGAATTQSAQGSGDDASADAAAPLDATVGPFDGDSAASLDVHPGLGDGWGPKEGPAPPPPPPDDAQAPDAAGDADGYADAMPDRTGTGFPAEAPPQ
jgi:hypothetical protein